MVFVAPVFLHALPVDFNKGDNGALVSCLLLASSFHTSKEAVLQTRIINSGRRSHEVRVEFSFSVLHIVGRKALTFRLEASCLQ